MQPSAEPADYCPYSRKAKAEITRSWVIPGVSVPMRALGALESRAVRRLLNGAASTWCCLWRGVGARWESTRVITVGKGCDCEAFGAVPEERTVSAAD
jgi:hypothetical protein